MTKSDTVTQLPTALRRDLPGTDRRTQDSMGPGRRGLAAGQAALGGDGLRVICREGLGRPGPDEPLAEVIGGGNPRSKGSSAQTCPGQWDLPALFCHVF